MDLYVPFNLQNRENTTFKCENSNFIMGNIFFDNGIKKHFYGFKALLSIVRGEKHTKTMEYLLHSTVLIDRHITF